MLTTTLRCVSCAKHHRLIFFLSHRNSVCNVCIIITPHLEDKEAETQRCALDQGQGGRKR